MNAYTSFVRKTPPDVEVAAGLNFNPTDTKRANNCAPTAGIFSLDTLIQRKFSVTNVVNAATLDLLVTAFGEDRYRDCVKTNFSFRKLLALYK